MGQRSQLIVNIHTVKDGKAVKSVRIARHYQWVWGQFLIFRAAQLAKFLYQQANNGLLCITSEELEAAIPAIYGVNFINGDVQGLHPNYDVSDAPIKHMDNNDGYVVVDVTITPNQNQITSDLDFKMGIIETTATGRGLDYQLVAPGDYMAHYSSMELRNSSDWQHISSAVIALEALIKDYTFASTEKVLAAADALVPGSPEVSAA